MLRVVLGALAGYLVMAFLLFGTFTLAYALMGTEGAFQPASYEVSGLWLGVSFILAILAAVVGGFVCASVGRTYKAVLTLVVMVLVLGLLSAIPVILDSDSGEPRVRGVDVGSLEAMQAAKQPVWVALLNPLVGIAGVFIGARLKRPASPA